MNILLWILQILLALLFLFSGAIKLVLPVEEMTKQMPVHLPGLFLRFIGVCEILGGIGLILPALLRIEPWLTPLAAAGLLIIMIGAVVIGLMSGTNRAGDSSICGGPGHRVRDLRPLALGANCKSYRRMIEDSCRQASSREV
jgi:uncharacterized membrane protein YphA (DoxX/SURF4 family)